ncbi:MAG: tetratricopeptide repeat protein, partial [Chloroflexi bacterium]
MSNISLKQYLNKIDSLLEDGYYDEAAFHCRHILSQQPKNIAAYRRLGRALVALSRWEDAGEVLRRVLSVAPDDKMAHINLSRVYDATKQPGRAIWHLERAYEQDPNNQTLIEQLRDLYYRHHGLEDVRLQLTAGSAARQYAANGLYDQAITVLSNTLKEAKDRVDLRLLKARIQREAGYHIDAAETAVDVLQTLPDCLEANFILAELWLSEQRPSDAQRYLSRIEPVDPYLALKLAYGHSAADDEVMLTEGDYQKETSRTLTEAAPDWLQEIGDEAISDASDEFTFDALDTEFNDELTTDITDSNSLLEASDEADNLDWLSDIEPSEESSEDQHPSTGMTGMLAALESAADNEENLFDDLLNETEDDDLSWLEEDAAPSEQFDWLANADDTGEETSESPGPSPQVTRQFSAESDVNDPLAWLKESGIELVDDAPGKFNQFAVEEDNGDFLSPADDDPMAWLKESGIELVDDEAETAEGLAEDLEDEVDPLAWLKESGIELIDDTAKQTPPVQPEPVDASDNIPEADSLDWLADDTLLDEMMDMEALTMSENDNWLDMDNDQQNTPASSEWETQSDWLSNDENEETTPVDAPDWLADMQPVD